MTNEKTDKEDGKLTVSFLDVPFDESLAASILRLIRKVEKGESRIIEAVNVVLTGDEKLVSLNRKYAAEDQVTDVLAFDLSASDQESVEGDIYISLERAQAQSVANGFDLHNEALHLAVHGFLHLCGYDHNDDVSLGSMCVLGEKYIDESY